MRDSYFGSPGAIGLVAGAEAEATYFYGGSNARLYSSGSNPAGVRLPIFCFYFFPTKVTEHVPLSAKGTKENLSTPTYQS